MLVRTSLGTSDTAKWCAYLSRIRTGASSRSMILMKVEGIPIARERVRLIRRREGLQVVKKRRKRKVLGMMTQWVHRACYPNHV